MADMAHGRFVETRFNVGRMEFSSLCNRDSINHINPHVSLIQRQENGKRSYLKLDKVDDRLVDEDTREEAFQIGREIQQLYKDKDIYFDREQEINDEPER